MSIIHSTLGTYYDPRSVVRIIDRRQQMRYVEHGVYPKDIYVSGEDFVMCFDKDETAELFRRWRAHEL